MDRKKAEVKLYETDRNQYLSDELRWRSEEARQDESQKMDEFEQKRFVSKLEPGAQEKLQASSPSSSQPAKKSVFDYVEDKAKEEQEAIRQKMAAQVREKAEFQKSETHWRTHEGIQEEHAKMDAFETKPIISKFEANRQPPPI